MHSLIKVWNNIANKPGGKWTFSKAITLKAPYFASISPTIVKFEPGVCAVQIKDKRAVQNHIGTVHAIAMCNIAELAAGMALETALPKSNRWIPKGMEVKYQSIAKGTLVGTAVTEVKEYAEATDVPIRVSVRDSKDVEVFSAVINMYVTPKTKK